MFNDSIKNISTTYPKQPSMLDKWLCNNFALIKNWLVNNIDSHPATAISYDNEDSGLIAEDVQAAIDELAATSISEAPVDAKYYARKDGAWADINDGITRKLNQFSNYVDNTKTYLKTEMNNEYIVATSGTQTLPASMSAEDAGKYITFKAEATFLLSSLNSGGQIKVTPSTSSRDLYIRSGTTATLIWNSNLVAWVFIGSFFPQAFATVTVATLGLNINRDTHSGGLLIFNNSLARTATLHAIGNQDGASNSTQYNNTGSISIVAVGSADLTVAANGANVIYLPNGTTTNSVVIPKNTLIKFVPNANTPAGWFVIGLPPIASKIPYTPTTSSDWDGTITNVGQALDEIASRIRALE